MIQLFGEANMMIRMLCMALAWTAVAFFQMAHGSPAPRVVEKVGSCPSGYSVSGNFCKPNSSARFAIPKVGSCPSGYSVSGAYCLAGSRARHEVRRHGSQPPPPVQRHLRTLQLLPGQSHRSLPWLLNQRLWDL